MVVQPSKDSLILPNFLGIGAPRSGSTWLHRLLETHPDVLVPSRRKETRFFTEHYERGLDWYSESFGLSPGANKPTMIGEITPFYMYSERCIDRIKEVGSADKFLVCLRNPADRLNSAFKVFSARENLKLGMFDFIKEYPDVVQLGFYARALEPWYREFDSSQFLLLEFEKMVTNVEATKHELASFLSVDASLFSSGAGKERVNYSYQPQFPFVYRTVRRAVKWFHDSNLSEVVHMGKRLGLQRVYERMMPPPSGHQLTDMEHEKIQEIYSDDMMNLRSMTGFDISSWIES